MLETSIFSLSNTVFLLVKAKSNKISNIDSLAGKCFVFGYVCKLLWRRHMSVNTIFLFAFAICPWRQLYCLLNSGIVRPTSSRPLHVIVCYFIDFFEL